jgi:hypothetical protein
MFVEVNFQSGTDFFDAHIEKCNVSIQEKNVVVRLKDLQESICLYKRFGGLIRQEK